MFFAWFIFHLLQDDYIWSRSSRLPRKFRTKTNLTCVEIVAKPSKHLRLEASTCHSSRILTAVRPDVIFSPFCLVVYSGDRIWKSLEQWRLLVRTLVSWVLLALVSLVTNTFMRSHMVSTGLNYLFHIHCSSNWKKSLVCPYPVTTPFWSIDVTRTRPLQHELAPGADPPHGTFAPRLPGDPRGADL